MQAHHPASILALLVLSAPALCQSPPPAGEWSGRIDLPDGPLEVRVALRHATDAWQGSIDIPAQGARGLPLTQIAVDGTRVTFVIDGVGGAPTFAGELAQDGSSIAGRFTQGGQSFPFTLNAMQGASFDGVQAWVDELRGEFRVPGCAVAVIKGGELTATFTSGERDVERGLPVTPDTLFAIGSSTKAFTTLLLGQLVEEGKLDWDQPVRTWIPEFALDDRDAGEHLTPRDLVTHRSGMPRHDLAWFGATFDRADMVRRLRYLPLSEGLRSAFQYNNLMLLTAGHLAERVTGQSWESLVRQRIFTPLGMTRSNFDVKQSAADQDHAEPYRDDDEKVTHIPFRDITAIGPAGSIDSSVREMARWVALHLQGGKHGDVAVVQPGTMRDLHRVRMPIDDGATSPDVISVGYALGWFVDVYRGARRVQHGGNIDGFSALVAFLPDAGYGFVVLTNLDGTPLPEMIVRRLCDRALGLSDRDWATEALARVARARKEGEKAKQNEDLERRPGTRPSHELTDYAGDYSHPGYGACTVGLGSDGLHIEFHGLGAPLAHWHYDVFRCGKDAANPQLEGTKVQFTTDLDGDIDGLRVVLEPATGPTVFARQPDAQLRDPAFLQRLVGDYELGGQTARFALRGDALTLELPGQFHVLVPRRALVFGIGALSGYSVRFVTDAQGEVTGCRFRQPEGVFEATRKAGR